MSLICSTDHSDCVQLLQLVSSQTEATQNVENDTQHQFGPELVVKVLLLYHTIRRIPVLLFKTVMR